MPPCRYTLCSWLLLLLFLLLKLRLLLSCWAALAAANAAAAAPVPTATNVTAAVLLKCCSSSSSSTATAAAAPASCRGDLQQMLSIHTLPDQSGVQGYGRIMTLDFLCSRQQAVGHPRSTKKTRPLTPSQSKHHHALGTNRKSFPILAYHCHRLWQRLPCQ